LCFDSAGPGIEQRVPAVTGPFGIAREQVERLAARLAEAVPASLGPMREEVEQNFRAVLAQGLAKLDLVTREEFEVQQAVLERTREKLKALEARLSELESD
jgi:ubiquinone biosynthesis accessory factor UbiK